MTTSMPLLDWMMNPLRDPDERETFQTEPVVNNGKISPAGGDNNSTDINDVGLNPLCAGQA